mgnify:CR=1 FL=1
MGEAWKSLSIQDKASMIMHFMQITPTLPIIPTPITLLQS